MNKEKVKLRLPKEFAERWIEALKSGKYKQGLSELKNTDRYGNCKYCCLGVAAELIRNDNKELPDIEALPFIREDRQSNIGNEKIGLSIDEVNQFISKGFPKELIFDGPQLSTIAGLLSLLNDLTKKSFNKNIGIKSVENQFDFGEKGFPKYLSLSDNEIDMHNSFEDIARFIEEYFELY